MPQPRSPELQLVAYALARCGVPGRGANEILPPPWLETSVWKEAYDQFYPALADGREAKSFRNTLKHARDAFDAHVENGRIGWVDHKAGGRPYRADTMVRAVLHRWQGRPDVELIAAVLAIRGGGAVSPDELDDDQHDEDNESGAPPEGTRRTEGGKAVYVSWRYERALANRRDAVRIHGCVCMACRFDFAAAYGAAGSGYIEVHHAVPLAEHGMRETDPATDLIVLCANCHRMVHRKRGVCLSLGALRALVDDGRKRTGQPRLWPDDPPP